MEAAANPAPSSDRGAAPAPAAHVPTLNHDRKRRLYMILGVSIVVILILYAIWAFLTAGKESTDDAQVAADIVSIAPRISGQVTTVYVKDNQRVKEGDPIAQIDPRDAEVRVTASEGDLQTAQAQAAAAEARLQIARATARGGVTAAQAAVQGSRERVGTSSSGISDARAGVARAEANAQKARNDWQRAQELGAKGDISKAQVDGARAATDAAAADLAGARARLQSAEQGRQLAEADVLEKQGKLQQTAPAAEQIRAAEAEAALGHAHVQSAAAALQAARLNLSYARVTAPRDGIASRLSVHPGSLISVGQPIVQLVPLQTYVIANFKETQLESMKPGQRASVKIDAMGRTEYEGIVESMSGGTGASFSLLPPDNASGNFVKVVQRVPVRIRWNGPPADRIPVGVSAEVTVYTK